MSGESIHKNVGRPSKDSKRLNFNLSSGLYDELLLVCGITGRNRTDEIETALKSYIKQFRDNDGCISGKKAYYCIRDTLGNVLSWYKCFVLDDSRLDGLVKIYWHEVFYANVNDIAYEEPINYVRED